MRGEVDAELKRGVNLVGAVFCGFGFGGQVCSCIQVMSSTCPDTIPFTSTNPNTRVLSFKKIGFSERCGPVVFWLQPVPFALIANRDIGRPSMLSLLRPEAFTKPARWHVTVLDSILFVSILARRACDRGFTSHTRLCHKRNRNLRRNRRWLAHQSRPISPGFPSRAIFNCPRLVLGPRPESWHSLFGHTLMQTVLWLLVVFCTSHQAHTLFSHSTAVWHLFSAWCSPPSPASAAPWLSELTVAILSAGGTHSFTLAMNGERRNRHLTPASPAG